MSSKKHGIQDNRKDNEAAELKAMLSSMDPDKLGPGKLPVIDPAKWKN